MKKKHADLIIAWANGAAIQHRAPGSTEWKDNADPAWVEDYEYRVKPAREYPETRMDGYELSLALLGLPPASNITAGYTAIANATLRHAIDAGQVVTREEFDRAIGDRDSRDLKVVQAAIDHFEPSLKLFKLQVPQAWQLQAVIREWVK